MSIYTIYPYKAGDEMLSIAVCDDEVIECCNMAKRIKEIMEEMKIPCIIRQFRSGGELLQALESFDIVFLDIIMQDLDGMKTAQAFRKKASDKILIFISSSREYVFEAYDVEAFQYLLKPVDDRKLKNVLQKAIVKTQSRSQEFIIVSRERQKKKLFLDDIYYFEIKGRIVDAHGPEGIFTYYEQIGELENKIRDKGFFRCHKSYLINLKYVDGYSRKEVVLENGEKIVIAKRRYDEFVQEMLKVMRKNGGIL
ncbi:LytR/AlgR family response regulator transcription factor [Acetatifactor aquisgranensis]|uniref:LytR/AlgR family response regulator transcription factor n=1 Tax=Acetatifactor aquisgranensis TaxID=2941233 RepID=UPI00203B7935|nr:LytTR family DNA-binding domain-containing protein [Acetatifactor aquisgranensis]